MIFFKRLILFIVAILVVTACRDGLQQPVYTYVLNNPADTGSRFPNLYQDTEGTIYMSWLMNIEENLYALKYTTFENDSWSPVSTIRIGTDFFVNWADFASVVGLHGNVVAAHWLKTTGGGPYAYNIEIAFPDEEARRWDTVITPHLDGTATEHGFVSMEPLADDSVLAIWLDGRNTDGRGHHEYEDINKAMTLRSAEISSDGEITRKREIDDVVCDCCQTDLIPVDDGYLAVYRGRTEDEIRDIRIVRYDSESGEWSSPVKVHEDGWQVMACPVSGPRIVSRGNHVAVAWYTGADDEPRINVARSTDGGHTFQEPIIVAEDGTPDRTDLVLTDEGSVYVSWLQQQGEAGYVMLREVQPDGQLADAIHVGTTSSSRISGFPRIKKVDDFILLAWTQTEPFIRVRTARVNVGM